MSRCDLEECLGRDVYESLVVLQEIEPERYGNLLADFMRIRCTCCDHCEDIEVLGDDEQ